MCVITVGPLRSFYLEGARDYLRRLTPYAACEIRSVRPEPLPARLVPGAIEQIKQKEGDRLLAAAGSEALLIALDSRGESFTSEAFARQLDAWWVESGARLTFVIGGTLGLAESVRRAARASLSLSRLTFPHELAALILLEQIYRAFRILRGEPYHY
ncbi:MAG: 23S rRNA (pseudouridine(1915)-N(3))-methyltransferase RlmH [Limnochordales bacterium]|nr:23S rRNA (pseudouridine(1915)-N(3))-methyltransferase RlmH [Limnochordales bacterium]